MGARASEIPPDTVLAGKIRLIKRIGRGGMGDVWVAKNEATQAELAVKTIQRDERSPEHDERFRREARLSATLSHRNVVRVFDLVDEPGGTLGLVMELLHGGTLEDCMRGRGPLSSVQALAVVLPLLSAMHHVHQKGIVHRDLKPANVFFAVEPDGHVIPKLLDFGIAKLPSAGSALTVDGSVLGTPHYMSPEQIRGQGDLDGRSDMFSIAVVLYEMLTGLRVFQRETAAASLAAVLEHEVDPDPRIEPRLWIAISRALAKRPYERFASCAELADALRASTPVAEDELVQALQELRPLTTAPSSSATDAESIALSRNTRASAGLPRRFGYVLPAAVAAAAVTIVAAVSVGVTGRSAALSSAPSAASSSLSPPVTVARDVPAPSPSLAPAPSPAPSSAPPGEEPRPSADARPPSKPRAATDRPPTEKKSRPKGSVATTPGF